MVRLPDELSTKEKMDKLNEIVDVLDLNKCKDTSMYM